MPEPTQVLCLVSEWPSPTSNDARLRQLARRLSALCGSPNSEVTVAALEPLGSAPADAPFAVISLDPLSFDRLPQAVDVLITSGVFPPTIEDKIVQIDNAERVMWCAALTSHTMSSSEADYRAPDSLGLQTLIDHQRQHERRVFDRCNRVLCDDKAILAAVKATGTAPIPELNPILLPDRTVATPSPDRRLLHVGQWATGTGADELALQSILEHADAAPNRLPVRTTLLGEDVLPAGRQVTRDFPRMRIGTALESEISHGAVVVSTGTTGPPTTARIIESAALGAPVIVSSEMAEALPHKTMLQRYITRSTGEAIALATDLLDDDTAWQEASDSAAAWADAVGERESQATPDWSVERRCGAFDFQRQMKAFERELIPEPALDRDDTALLQPNMTEDERYRLKLRVHERQSYFDRCTERIDSLVATPTFSIVMPTYNIDRATLLSAIESVRSQLYPHWQLCVVDDASPSTETQDAVRSLPALDDRITVRVLDENVGIAGATNAAIELASGDFVGFLDHDDELRPDALYWYARLLDARPDLEVIYSDEDKLNDEGERWWPFHKPDWSPAMLTNVNYMTHFLVTRRSLLESVGRVRTGFDGAQDYDLILRLTAATKPHLVGHVAKPLYSWRVIEGSTSGDIEAKPEAHNAGHRALTDWLAHQPGDGFVTNGSVPTVHLVRYRVPSSTKVSVIIPTKDRVDLMRLCLHSVRDKTDFDNYEIIVVDNNTTDPETINWLDDFGRTEGRVIRYPHQFNYGRQMNLAAAEATGDLLLFLNNDAQVHTDHWMRAMAEQALLPDVGAVGARLMFPDGRTQHEGIGLGMAGPAVNLSFGGHRGYDQFIRDCVAVTGAAMMLRATVFDDVGGFDDKLRVAFNDVDLCLRIGERGYRNVYTPLAELGHPESASRGSLHPIPDEDLFHRRWGTKGQLRDPWLNQNFEWFAPLLYRI